MTGMLRRNVFDRHRLTQSLFAWSYAFARPSPVVPCHALGIEIGVVLRGARRLTDEGGERLFARGSISALDLGEHYATAYEPPLDGASGREIGFVLRPDLDDRWSSGQSGLTFSRAARFDPRMTDLCQEIARTLDEGAPLDVGEIASEVNRFIDVHAEVHPLDALGRAHLAIHRDFNVPLYMRHFAEIAGVHPATFARSFRDRYGETPVRYRMRLRLAEAAALFALRPDRTVRDIATKVGFEDVPYFHRAFASCYGTTPIAFGREWAGIVPAAQQPALKSA